MKARFLTLLSLAAMSYAAQAQTSTTTAAAATEVVKPAMTKEEKAAQKAKQDAELAEAFKGAGLSETQIKSVHEAMDMASKANSELKKNASLTEEQQAEAKKKITDEKNAKIKEIMGAEAYKKYSAIRKEQKAKAAEAGN